MSTNMEVSQSRSLGRVGLINIGATTVGFFQALIIGKVFGVSIGIEVYFAAAVFYQVILGLLQTGQIVEIAIPVYHKLKCEKGRETAFALFSALLNWFVAIGGLLSVVCVFLAPVIVPFIAPGFRDEEMMECIAMFQWIVPCLALQIINSLISSLIAAEQKYASQELGKLICQILSLGVLLVFSAEMGAWVMVLSLWTLNILSGLFLGLLSFRIGYRHSFIFTHSFFSVSTIFKKLPHVFGYVGMTQLYSVMLTAGLSVLPSGSLAIFTYARKISSRINGLLNRPVSLVFFNQYSEAISQGSATIRKLVKEALRISLVFVTLAIVIVFTAGYPGFCAIWLGNEFPLTAVSHTYLAVCVLSLVPIFSVAGLIYRKISMSHQMVREQYFWLTLVQALCAVLAYFFIPIFGLKGAIGIVVLNPLLFVVVNSSITFIKSRSSFQLYEPSHFLKCSAMALAGVIPTLVGQARMYSPTQCNELESLLIAFLSGGIGLIVAVLVGWLLNVAEIRSVVQIAVRKIR
ncbi:hypothetical protein N9H09_00245 [bacterium]|nr:hypothetical protein [bacterium]